MKTQLGTFAGYTAYWGYSEDFDDDGLIVNDDFYAEGSYFPFCIDLAPWGPTT